MALGPQQPSNWTTADYWIEVTPEGNILIRPCRPLDMRHLAEWLFKELSRDPWRWGPEPIRPVIDRWFGRFHDFRLFRGEGAHEGALMVEALDSSEAEITEWVTRKLNASEVGHAARPTYAEIVDYLQRIGLEIRGAPRPVLPGTDWVIARDTSNMAKVRERPGRLPGQPPELEEMFWSGALWVKDLGLAKRFADTGRAVYEMMNARIPDNRPARWEYCYLARVAAKPEPRYEVVDRP